jgi:hypothetical protein
MKNNILDFELSSTKTTEVVVSGTLKAVKIRKCGSVEVYSPVFSRKTNS